MNAIPQAGRDVDRAPDPGAVPDSGLRNAEALRRAGDAVDQFSWVPYPVAVLVGAAAGHVVASVPGQHWTSHVGFFLVSQGILLLAALLGMRLVQSLAAALRSLADLAELSWRLERQSRSHMLALTAALEAVRNAAPPSPGPDHVADLRARHLAEIRQAIRAASWDDAAVLVGAFAGAHPDDPDAARAVEGLAEARRAAGQALLTRIEAAREANDPDRVIELRDEAKALLGPEALQSLDRDLARWFLVLIQRRLRAGTVRADVAVLAGRVAQSLDGTPEGASLRASLPTLRRAAGLCARCGQPYKGIADACPACLTGPNGAQPAPPPVPRPPSGE